MTAATKPRRTPSLTARQRAFAHAYIACHNASQAAREAGCTPNSCGTTGWNWLQKPHVKAYIAEIMKKAARTVELDAAFVLELMQEIAADPDESGQTRVTALDKLAKVLGLYEEDNAQRKMIIQITEEETRL